MNDLADELRKILKGEVLDDEQSRDKASRDASLFHVPPEVVVRPRDVEDVQALVRFAMAEKQKGRKISLTVRSGGTDMSGGPLNDSIIVDMTHFNRIIEVGEDYAVVEPGTYFRDFDRETKKKDLELPSYTASREICTVGGMVANDSGGEKNLKYGKTARYVEELEVVMADGEVHTLKPGATPRGAYEDEVYAKVTTLLTENRGLIQEKTPIVSKNSTGYALWDLGTPPNLARLMTGAQGTLGIITKIRFRLVHPKPFGAMLVIFLKDLADLGPMVPEILKDAPDSFESYDDHTFTFAVKYFPELAAQMKAGIISIGLSFIPEMFMLATGGVPKLVLLIEFRSDAQKDAVAKAEALKQRIDPLSKTESMRIARSDASARKYWAVRREAFNLLRKNVRGRRTAPCIDDFVVPPGALSEFLPRLTALLNTYDFPYAVTGHVGDGNFHIFPLLNPAAGDYAAVVAELSQKVYNLVLSYHGSISGEHNDGFIRTPYVEQMFGVEMMRLFEEVKHIFDPENIFNPGKKVDTPLTRALAKLDIPTRS